MPILNYTTKIDSYKTITEIPDGLLKLIEGNHRVVAFLIYNRLHQHTDIPKKIMIGIPKDKNIN